MTNQQLLAELARLKAENNNLKAKASDGLTMKVSDKGAISIYGMGKFPWSPYAEQVVRILRSRKAIVHFMLTHKNELAVKHEEFWNQSFDDLLTSGETDTPPAPMNPTSKTDDMPPASPNPPQGWDAIEPANPTDQPF